ncbi:hypothetical protein LP420_35165 [Massilia sp. B-10]|nr:hypothetical protein LP420_35165 [Massilia sp. B-10]
MPAAQRTEFAALLRQAYCPDLAPFPAEAELPPCARSGTDKWSAFIHPDLGASFADEPWLEVTPPEHGQVALLEHLESISDAQFAQALGLLRAKQGAAPAGQAPRHRQACCWPTPRWKTSSGTCTPKTSNRPSAI